MRRTAIISAVALTLILTIGCQSKAPRYMDDASKELADRKELFTKGDLWSVLDSEMSAEERQAMEFMYGSMSIADLADQTGDYYLANVRKALQTRSQMAWGKQIDDDLFYHFVLPVRVNNETLDDFRTEMYDQLAERVKGLSLYDAALEVNHWCHEHVVYEPSDSRTSSPLATIRTSKGRCGEESVLTVAALRTVGIPARQVYTPRWAHTDDNHAWVEVWVDGKWWFMGACEPAPVLNYAWFNAPAARAMLMHTRVFGSYYGGNDIMERTRCFTEINVIDTYCQTQRLDVKVVDKEGNAVEGAMVEWKIYNYAEFYTVGRKTTDAQGLTSLTTGKGDLLVWASKDDRFGIAKLDDQAIEVVLDHKQGDTFALDLDIVPPAEGIIEVNVTPEQESANNLRLTEENTIREKYTSTFATAESLGDYSDREKQLIVAARGNWRDIKSFIDNCDLERRAEAVEMLGVLAAKDLRDTPTEVLNDCIEQTIPNAANPLYIEYILNPRISGEMIRPYKAAIRERLEPVLGSDRIEPQKLVEWTAENIMTVDQYNPLRLQITPAGVLRTGAADSRSRNIFFVAVCRTFDIAARIDRVTGKTQYWHQGWQDVDFDDASAETAPQGSLTATYQPTKLLPDPTYYRHFTISKIDNEQAKLLNFESGDQTELGAEASWRTLLSTPYNLDSGYYMISSGKRMASGRVKAHVEFFNIRTDSTTELELTVPQDSDDVEVVGFADAEQLYMAQGEDVERSLLSTTGRGYFVVAVLGSKDEPSNHAVRGLAAMVDVLNGWGRKVVVLSPSQEQFETFDRQPFKSMEQIVAYGIDVDGKVAKMIREGCNSRQQTLPVIAVADSFGRIVYFSQGYNTSVEEQMRSTIDRLRNE